MCDYAPQIDRDDFGGAVFRVSEVASGCIGLTSIEIPASVKSIGNLVFDRCENLTIFGVPGSYAQEYADRYDISFSALKEDHIHSCKTTTTKASTENKQNGSIVEQCDKCGAVIKSETIYYAESIGLVPTSYTYNGTEKKPSAITGKI